VLTEKLVQIESWSFSRKQTYDQCPARARYLYIDKLKEPDTKSPALLHGTRVHALAAAWITRRLPDFTAWDGKELAQFRPELERVIKMKTVPEELTRFEQEFVRLRKLKARCEEMWNLNRDWEIIPGKAWSPHVWLRIKVDVHLIEKGRVEIHDWKTGKFKPDHAEQRSVYAIGALKFYPEARSVVVYHNYLDQGIEKHDEWAAGDLEQLRKEWETKTTALLNDTSFVATPSPDACRWCAFKKSLGGPCIY
jgi:PD-(D/E)XK nuclease superfamily